MNMLLSMFIPATKRHKTASSRFQLYYQLAWKSPRLVMDAYVQLPFEFPANNAP